MRQTPRHRVPIAALAAAAGFVAGAAWTSRSAADAAMLPTKVAGWNDSAAGAVTAKWGELRWLHRGETPSLKDLHVRVVVVKPGEAVHKAHRHAEEEFIYIAEGSGTWRVDGKDMPLQKNDTLYVSPWDFHGLTNTGKDPLTFFVVKWNGKAAAPPPHPGDGKPDEEK